MFLPYFGIRIFKIFVLRIYGLNFFVAVLVVVVTEEPWAAAKRSGGQSLRKTSWDPLLAS